MSLILFLIGINHLEDLVNNLDLKKKVKFISYSSKREIYFMFHKYEKFLMIKLTK